MSNLRYRPEIDGLRAIAVLGVVLYHIGLGFPGGYVGVDVFFVISGFLITGIIVKDLKRGTFSMLDFWVRRIRRIMPAVTVMVVICLIAGYILLSPDAFKGLAKSSIAQSLMASNVYFWRDTGYFTESAEFKPLLHTWSLAVEEQFYVFFPLVLFAFWKWWKHQVIPVLLILGGFSFLLSCLGVIYYPQATFFLLPARAWEMLAGGLLAVWSGKKELSHKSSEIVAWAGLLMIAYAMLIYSHDTLFPGWAALLPVLGSVLFIGANKGTVTSAGRFLSAKPMVFIGLISYSLYLWHWPLLAFARTVVIDINLPWKLALLAGSMILAIISWRFVETPFRRKTVLATKVSAFGFGAVSTALLLIFSVVIWKSNGMPSRIDDEMVLLIEDIDWIGSEYESSDGSLVYLGLKPESPDSQIDFALWGDSHGMAIAATVDECAKKQGLRGIAYLESGTPPVTGLWKSKLSNKEHQIMLNQNESVVKSILHKGIKNVILVARWSVDCDGFSDAELESGIHYSSELTDPMVIDQMHVTPTPQISSAALSRQLKLMIKMFKRAGVKVWLLKQVPEVKRSSAARAVYMLKRFSKINHMDEYCTPLLQHERRQANANKAIDRLPAGLCEVIDLTPHFFGNSEKLKIYDKRSYYRDDNHLTRHGAKYYLTNVFTQIRIHH